MKVWLLDNGSIVIEHTQLLWNVPGPQVRIPVYSVLVEHDEGLFLFDTGIDLDHMPRVLPFELPEQTPEQTIPAQLALCGFSVSPDRKTVIALYAEGICYRTYRGGPFDLRLQVDRGGHELKSSTVPKVVWRNGEYQVTGPDGAPIMETCGPIFGGWR